MTADEIVRQLYAQVPILEGDEYNRGYRHALEEVLEMLEELDE